MKKKILFSFIFIFISLFFTTNVKGATYSGSTGYNPTQPSAFPNFITDKVYYDNVRDVLFNDILGGANQSTQETFGTSSEYQYMFSYFNYESGRANRQTVYFLTDIPTWSYNSTYNGYVFTLPTGSKYVRFTRSYYSDWGRFENSFSFSNEFNSNTIGSRTVYNSTFSGTGYILNTNNFTLDSSLLSYLTNIPSDRKIILNFNYNNVINYNPEYLDNNSSWTKHCLNSQNTFFSVLPNTINTSNHDLVNNYILFPYLLYDYGINWLQYNTINSSNLYENNYDLAGLYDYKFFSQEEMERLSTDTYIQDFNSRYSGLYNNLYGWNLFLNRVQYTEDDKYNIQVFHFNNSYIESVFCHVVGDNNYCEAGDNDSGGGGGHSFVVDDTVVNTPTDEICFYIPSNMYLKVWEINEYNDIDDTITLNGNDYNITTDSYQIGYNSDINNNTYSGYVGYFKSLINACRVPLNFISSKITLFFNSMPPLIQYALITFIFVSIVVGLIKFLTGGK